METPRRGGVLSHNGEGGEAARKDGQRVHLAQRRHDAPDGFRAPDLFFVHGVPLEEACHQVAFRPKKVHHLRRHARRRRRPIRGTLDLAVNAQPGRALARQPEYIGLPARVDPEIAVGDPAAQRGHLQAGVIGPARDTSDDLV